MAFDPPLDFSCCCVKLYIQARARRAITGVDIDDALQISIEPNKREGTHMAYNYRRSFDAALGTPHPKKRQTLYRWDFDASVAFPGLFPGHGEGSRSEQDVFRLPLDYYRSISVAAAQHRSIKQSAVVSPPCSCWLLSSALYYR